MQNEAAWFEIIELAVMLRIGKNLSRIDYSELTGEKLPGTPSRNSTPDTPSLMVSHGTKRCDLPRRVS
jgi:hypothetical protein